MSGETALRLTIGNKRYSSWSMRPWLTLKEFGVPFDEEVIPLYRADSKARLLERSPSGKAPVLEHDGATIWDSLAIIDYIAELRPDLPIWPRDRRTRAVARSLACETHSGFAHLRKECPMNFGRASSAIALSDEALADVARIDSTWRAARRDFGGDGGFLFGDFCAADAMFAPIVQRFETYGAPISPVSRDYMERMKGLASWSLWAAGARAEEWTLEQFEIA